MVEQIKLEIEENMSAIVQQQIATAKVLEQTVSQFLEVIAKEFSLQLTQEQLAAFESMTFEQIQVQLSVFMLEQLKAKFALMDIDRLYMIFKDVYLYHLDTLWVKHLDDMEYLRDKVGLMGYAQLDPLIVYKSEAYEKFQTLLYRLKFDVTAYIAGIDFAMVKQQDQNQQQVVMGTSQTEQEYLKMLEKVSSEFKDIKFEETTQAPAKMVYENADGYEVFEVNDDNQPVGMPNVFNESVIPQPGDKVRPNDLCPC